MPEHTTIHKTCTKCGRLLPLSHFTADKRKPFGAHSSCKDCVRAYRQANKRRLLQAQYARRTNNPEYSRQRVAWNAVYRALSSGKMTKPETCEVCGGWFGERIQAHHDDYSKLYDVVWCCQDCHIQLDRLRRVNHVRA